MEGRKERLIRDGNAFYEIDLECLEKKKREKQESEKKRQEKRQRE